MMLFSLYQTASVCSHDVVHFPMSAPYPITVWQDMQTDIYMKAGDGPPVSYGPSHHSMYADPCSSSLNISVLDWSVLVKSHMFGTHSENTTSYQESGYSVLSGFDIDIAWDYFEHFCGVVCILYEENYPQQLHDRLFGDMSGDDMLKEKYGLVSAHEQLYDIMGRVKYVSSLKGSSLWSRGSAIPCHSDRGGGIIIAKKGGRYG